MGKGAISTHRYEKIGSGASVESTESSGSKSGEGSVLPRASFDPASKYGGKYTHPRSMGTVMKFGLAATAVVAAAGGAYVLNTGGWMNQNPGVDLNERPDPARETITTDTLFEPNERTDAFDDAPATNGATTNGARTDGADDGGGTTNTPNTRTDGPDGANETNEAEDESTTTPVQPRRPGHLPTRIELRPNNTNAELGELPTGTMTRNSPVNGVFLERNQ